MASKDQQLDSLGQSRDLIHAQLLTLNVGLAAERFPEELKAAIGKVFDLTAVESLTRRMMTNLAEMGGKVADRQEQLALLELKLKGLEERIEALDFYLDEQMKGTT